MAPRKIKTRRAESPSCPLINLHLAYSPPADNCVSYTRFAFNLENAANYLNRAGTPASKQCTSWAACVSRLRVDVLERELCSKTGYDASVTEIAFGGWPATLPSAYSESACHGRLPLSRAWQIQQYGKCNHRHSIQTKVYISSPFALSLLEPPIQNILTAQSLANKCATDRKRGNEIPR
jgi:hypothetical protein